jgi:hypothetical protein
VASLALGGGALLTTNGGSTWNPVTFPSGFTVEDVQCPTSAACWAIGGASGNTEILSTANQGASWTVSLATGLADGGGASIFCASASACTAEGALSQTAFGGLGLTLWSTQDGGASWGNDGETTPLNLTCPTSTWCVADDEDGHLEIGTTGTSPVVGSVYTPVSPYRITDTRSGSGEPNAGKTLGAGATLAVQVGGTGSGNDGVPTSGATAVALNVTAVGPSASGYLTVWQTGVTQPLASNLNFAPGQTVANLVVVPLSTSGQVSIFNASGSTNVVVDVAGWFGPATGGSSAGEYVSAPSPTRIADTRSTSGEPYAGETLAAGGTLTVAGFSDAPQVSSNALALNVTVTDTSAGGYLTVYPAGTTRPVASNLNWTAGQTVAGRVLSQTDTTGSVTVYNGSSGTVDVIVDESGWFTASGASGGGLFTPVTPTRMADTRSGSGEPDAGSAPAPDDGDVAVNVAGVGNVPDEDVQAAMLNVTVTDTTASGFLSAADDDNWSGEAPSWSDLNWLAGQTVANSTVGDVGDDGAIDLVNGSTGSADVVVDVSGWFS